MIRRIKEKYNWIEINKHVENFIKQCETFQRRKFVEKI